MASYQLEMRKITVRFPGVVALDDVSFSVKKGSVHAVVGENGAGKSTLMRVLIGDRRPDSGEILFNGEPIKRLRKSNKHESIAMIYQEQNSVKEMTIAENVFLGRMPSSVPGFVSQKKLVEMCRSLFDRWELDYNPRQKMRELSIANTQMVEIVKAVSTDAQLIIMDEPSSAISEQEVQKLFELIRELKSRGITVILITHKLEEVFAAADMVTVMRDGKAVSTSPIGDITRELMISQMVGREISGIYFKENHTTGETLLDVRGLTKKNSFSDVSFSLREGEVLGFAGIVGSGRTEVMRCIFGLERSSGGQVFYKGEPMNVKTPRDAMRRGLAMVTENRKEDGLALCRSVRENMILPSLRSVSKLGFVSKAEETRRITEKRDELNIKAGSVSMLANQLSGGNQQKVILAKWLMLNPRVFILDEPTRGIDIGAKAEIYAIINELAKRGVGIILISSELPEVLGLSDRVAVMRSGKVVEIVEGARMNQEYIMRLATSEEGNA